MSATTQATEGTASRPKGERLLELENLKKHFAIRKGLFARIIGHVRAVDGVSLTVRRGETLALVGESGCGKSTVGKVAAKLIEPSSGAIHLLGRDITSLSTRRMRPLRREIQLIFQDPYSSLDPRMSAGDIIGEPLDIHGAARGKARQEKIAGLMQRVGLSPSRANAYPHEFSGGQRQRIGIARALALNPSLIICDEAVSALDVSIQAQVINLLMDLQDEKRLSYLFIAHDLAVVRHICHRVAVMYLGRVVESAAKDTLFSTPLHPYTEGLLAAVPLPEPRKRKQRQTILKGDVPSPIRPPPGCHFHPRCRYAMPRCSVDVPALREVVPGHWVSCHLHEDRVTFPLATPASRGVLRTGKTSLVRKNRGDETRDHCP